MWTEGEKGRRGEGEGEDLVRGRNTGGPRRAEGGFRKGKEAG